MPDTGRVVTASGQRRGAASLQAGAAQIEVTPPRGTQLAGDIGRHRPAELVVDPLYARALVLEAEGHTLCLLSVELMQITTPYAQEIRRRVAEGIGTQPEAVMLHTHQSHGAPSAGHLMIGGETPYVPPDLAWLRGGADEAYCLWVVERLVEVARQAHRRLEPALVGAASGIEARVAFNRRFVMRDGTVRTHPPAADPSIRYVEGPMDPELGVLCINTDSLRMPAMLLHHTCHPVHGYPQRWVTSGWPGAWARGIQEACGEDLIPLVLNGWCGNIHHSNHLDPTHDDDYRRLGRVLTETTLQVLKRITYQREVVLDHAVKRIKVPLREIPPAQLEEDRSFLAQHPEPKWVDEAKTSVDWRWIYAVSRLDLYERQQRDPNFDFEVQVFRIGDAAIVGTPGEPFVEGQLRIKLESPAYPTYVAHHCNADVGYIPTRQAFKGGGYETETCNWSRLAPEALDMVTDTAVAVLKELY